MSFVRHRRAVGLGLMLMSVSAGYVDSLSYRFLGQVFTSAMTGNVALMGLSLGQGDVIAALRSLTAFSGFVFGLVIGALILRRGSSRPALLAAVLLEALLLSGFGAFWRMRGAEAGLYGLIGLAAIAMGVQSAVAHRFGMPGVSTTYFTGTTTNIVFSLVAPGTGPLPAAPRRVAWPVLAFLSYVSGAGLSGWYTAGLSAPNLPLALPFLPCAATIILAALVAIAGPRGPTGNA